MTQIIDSEENIAHSNYSFVRSNLINKEEIALIDVREEAMHAQGHPLFAANISLSRIELDAYTKLPRLGTSIVTIDGGMKDWQKLQPFY